MVTAQNFLETLNTAGDVKEHWAFIDGLVRENRFGVLEQIARRLVAECAFELNDWKERSVFDHLMNQLALTDDAEAVLIALGIFPKPQRSVRPGFLEIARAETAAKVAFAQSPEAIENLLGKLSELETGALLLHEGVLRGKVVGVTPASVTVYNRLKAVNHPLAWLPLELLHIETDLPMRTYGKNGSGWSLPEGHGAFEPVELEDEPPGLCFVNAATADRVELIGAADENWRQCSNGSNQVGIFRVSPFGRFSFERNLPKLGLECIGPETVAEENVPLEAVFQHLFAVSANGGAYNRGCFGAYGRLNAWKSLAGLCGVTLEMNAEELLETALACRWGKFQGGDWFNDIFWDLGVVCLNPERGELVVLAATDVD